MSTQKRIFPDKGRRSMNSERLKRAPDRARTEWGAVRRTALGVRWRRAAAGSGRCELVPLRHREEEAAASALPTPPSPKSPGEGDCPQVGTCREVG